MARKIVQVVVASALALFAVGFFAAVAGAQEEDPNAFDLRDHAESVVRWAETEPAAYQFEYSEYCSGCAPAPEVLITVRDGEIESVETVDGSDTPIPDELRVTITDLLDRVGVDLNTDVPARARFNGRYGYPESFTRYLDDGDRSGFGIRNMRSLDPWPEIQAALDEARAKFTASTYQFTYTPLCFCFGIGPVSMQVVDGEVVWVVPDDPTKARTIPDLFDGIQDVITSDPDDLTVSFDPVLGYPTAYSVDRYLGLIDDEFSMTVTGFAEINQAVPEICADRLVTVDIAAGEEPTAGDDVIQGTPGADVIDGLGGRDIICGLGGNDLIYGGAGSDLIYSGGGNDVVYGGLGYDTVYGQFGADELHGGGNDDQLFGGSGYDSLYGDGGNDFLQGSGGNDDLYGGTGHDKLYGKAGDDRIWGEHGYDEIYAAGGDDQVWGGTFEDIIQGGAGDDVLEGGDEDDVLYGQGGNDTLRGDAGDDVLYAAAGDDVLEGGDGDDQLQGAAGNDTLRGGAGTDTLYGQADNDDLDGGVGDDTCLPGTGNDVLTNCY